MSDAQVGLNLPYGAGSLPLSIPRSNLLTVMRPPDVATVADPASEVERALSSPVGTAPLGASLHTNQRILIIIDDKTRATPQSLILPLLVRHILAKVPDADITFLIANGTHVPMSPEEIAERVGGDIARQYRFVNHDCTKVEDLVDLGTTPNGTPIQINRLATEADLVLAVGGVVPHPLAGWGGGAKIIQPGICSRETTAATHDLETISPVSHFGRLGNPMRLEIEEIVKKVPLHFMVNVIFDSGGHLVGVVAGDPIASHHAAVDLARSVWEVPVTALADIVVVSSHPADWDFWQAMKGLYAAELVVKRGGDILIVTPCPESYTLSQEHVETQACLRGMPAKQVLKKARCMGITDGAGVNVTTFMARIKELAFVQVFSPGITDYDMDILGFERATSVEDGLRRAFERQGDKARVTVITHGGDILPVWPG